MPPKEAWTAGSAHGPTPPPSESFEKEVKRRGGAFGPNRGNQKQYTLHPQLLFFTLLSNCLLRT